MTMLSQGQLVKVAGARVTLDGVVLRPEGSQKVIVAVTDRDRGVVLRTVARSAISERTEAGPNDEALQALIRRTPSTGRGGAPGGGAGGGGQRGHTRAPAHRATGR
jgi:hypothetical protein